MTEETKPAEAPVKKGNPSWKPPRRDDVKNKDPNLHYRWAWKDPHNIERKKDWGYSIASPAVGARATTGESNPTSVQELRDRVLMVCPKEEYEEHRRYFENETLKQTRAIKSNLQRDVAKATGPSAVIHGKIVIE